MLVVSAACDDDVVVVLVEAVVFPPLPLLLGIAVHRFPPRVVIKDEDMMDRNGGTSRC